MGVMPDTVKVIAVFVIAGVGAFDIVNLLLKLVFLCGIIIFRRHKVAVLRRVGSPKYAVHQAGVHGAARGKPRRYHDE